MYFLYPNSQNERTALILGEVSNKENKMQYPWVVKCIGSFSLSIKLQSFQVAAACECYYCFYISPNMKHVVNLTTCQTKSSKKEKEKNNCQLDYN